MGQHGRKAQQPSLFIDCRRLDGGDLMLAKAFADDIKTARQRRITEGAVRFARKWRPDRANERLFGLIIWACALARAAAMVAIDSLHLCMAALHAQDIKAHRT